MSNNIHNKEYRKKLIERYLNADSTSQEEGLLKDYFTNNIKTLGSYIFRGCKLLCDVHLPRQFGTFSWRYDARGFYRLRRLVLPQYLRFFAYPTEYRCFFGHDVRDVYFL